jgi:voltage-gated potassium channel
MFPSDYKSEEKLAMTINILMVVLVIISITLTIIESVGSIMTPELKNLFLSIHIAILAAFLAEFLYRLWSASQNYADTNPVKATFKFLIHPLTIIDMIVIAPLFAMIWTHDLHNADTVILRVLRFTSILNLFHFYRSSRVLRLLRDMSREIWFEMMVIFILSIQCILIAGVLFYALENGANTHVQNIFDGIWWSVVTLTTIGYGDVYPITFGGRILGAWNSDAPLLRLCRTFGNERQTGPLIGRQVEGEHRTRSTGLRGHIETVNDPPSARYRNRPHRSRRGYVSAA